MKKHKKWISEIPSDNLLRSKLEKHQKHHVTEPSTIFFHHLLDQGKDRRTTSDWAHLCPIPLSRHCGAKKYSFPKLPSLAKCWKPTGWPVKRKSLRRRRGRRIHGAEKVENSAQNKIKRASVWQHPKIGQSVENKPAGSRTRVNPRVPRKKKALERQGNGNENHL